MELGMLSRQEYMEAKACCLLYTSIMADSQLMERAEHVLYKTYNRFPVVFDHGKGVRLYDTQGREYLDFEMCIRDRPGTGAYHICQ